MRPDDDERGERRPPEVVTSWNRVTARSTEELQAMLRAPTGSGPGRELREKIEMVLIARGAVVPRSPDPNGPDTCRRCGAAISRAAELCEDCRSRRDRVEPLDRSGRSDRRALLLAVLLGPVGLWYKGRRAAGLAWLLGGTLATLATGGWAAPLVWCAIAVHAWAVEPTG